MSVELCGGSLSGSGDIRSPNYPMNYPNNSRCIWHLTSNSQYITLNFTEFKTEGKLDYVEVSTYSGISPIARPIR